MLGRPVQSGQISDRRNLHGTCRFDENDLFVETNRPLLTQVRKKKTLESIVTTELTFVIFVTLDLALTGILRCTKNCEKGNVEVIKKDFDDNHKEQNEN